MVSQTTALTFGPFLRQLRQRAGMTQADLADAAGCIPQRQTQITNAGVGRAVAFEVALVGDCWSEAGVNRVRRGCILGGGRLAVLTEHVGDRDEAVEQLDRQGDDEDGEQMRKDFMIYLQVR